MNVFQQSLSAINLKYIQKKDVNAVNNYRQLGIISLLTKIIEASVNVRLTNFLNKHKLRITTQFGWSNINILAYLMLYYM